MSTSAMLSGRPWVSFTKCVYLAVAKLLELRPRALGRADLEPASPVPVVGSVGGEKSLLSTAESR
jgi:hypothetical protein